MWPTAIGLILTLALGTLWLPLATHAQRPMTVPRIGYLDSRSPADAGGVPGSLEALRQGLRELGYVEGQNMRMEYRYAEGKRDRPRARGRVGAFAGGSHRDVGAGGAGGQGRHHHDSHRHGQCF